LDRWDADLAARDPAALAQTRRELADELVFEFEQFAFDRQWRLTCICARARRRLDRRRTDLRGTQQRSEPSAV